MDTDKIWKNLVFGIVTGIIVSLTITIICLPMSFAMNRYIYHPPTMRLVLGIFTGLGSIISFAILFIMRISKYIDKPIQYYGMFPFVGTAEKPSNFLLYIFYAMFHPFQTEITGSPEDMKGYADSIKHLLVPETDLKDPTKTKTFDVGGQTISVTKGAVSETLMELCREAGRIEKTDEWSDKMKKLSPACTWMFSIN